MFPLGALIAGDPAKSGLQTYDATLDQMGQAALGRGIQQMFQPQMPGAIPTQQPGLLSRIGSGIGSMFTGGGQQQAQAGGGAPMSSPMGGGAPQQAAVPMAQSMAPPPPPQQPMRPPPQQGGGMGPAQAIGQMSYQQLLQAIVQANPGASPGVLAHAMKAAQPFMNTLALNEYRNSMLGLKQEGLDLQARGQDLRYGAQQGNQDIRLFAIQNAQYWQGVATGTIDPSVTPPPQPPQRGIGPRSEAPAQPGQFSPQQVQAAQPPEPVGQQPGSSAPLPAKPVQTVPIRPAAQAQPEDPMQVARGRLAEGLRQEAAAGGGRAASLEDTTTVPQTSPKEAAAAPQKTAQAEAPMAPIDRLAKGIKDGSIPPDMSKIPAKQRGVLIPRLQKEGVDLSRAELEWKQAQRDVNAMNTSQQVALVGAAKAGLETMKRVRELSHKLGMGGLKPWNAAALETAIQTGNTDAVAYDTALRVLKEDLGKVSTGGYAPTESVWKLVNRQYDPTYGEKQLNAALDETERFINNRIKSIDVGRTGLGPTTPGRYLQPPGGAAPEQGSEPVAVDPKTGRKAIYRDGKWQIQPAGQ